MRKTAAALLVFVLAAILQASALGTYSDITMADTLETITERYGDGFEYEDYLKFDDALCSFYESGRLRAKIIMFDDIRDAAALTHADFALVRDMREGTAMEKLISALGEGAEIMMMNLSDEENAGQRMLCAWKNDKGGVIEALFELDSDEWILFALGEIND